MKSWLMFLVMFFFVLSPVVGKANEFTGQTHATAMLLLSDSDQSVALAAKSLFWNGSDERELLDVLGEVIWGACSGKRKLEPDTLSWLAKAIGKTKQSRYVGLVNFCLSKGINSRSTRYMILAKKELPAISAEPFEGGHIDLPKIHASLTHPRANSQNQLVERFNELHKDLTLTEIYSIMGYPDEVGVATTSAGNRANPLARWDALALIYKDIGTIQFFSEEEQLGWKIDTAINSKGLLLSTVDWRFMTPKELITHGNAVQLREAAEYLITIKPLANDVFDAIMSRIKIPADHNDEELVDALAWLVRVVFESENADYEKSLTLSLLTHGDGPQLRRVADRLLAKNAVEKDVLDAVMARINTSRDTQDDKLADSLAWLCKVILKSGDVKYKDAMSDVAKTAAHKSLRRHASSAAEGLIKKSLTRLIKQQHF